MRATQSLYRAGQSLWLDNITRDLLASGALKGDIDELSITGLTSNPTIFDHAIKNGSTYDDAIRRRQRAGGSGESLDYSKLLQSARVFAEFRKAGVELDALAAGLQEEGTASFVSSWIELLGVIASKSASLARAS